ncbi:MULTISPECIES: TetR family transcriptional regulator [unclassified Phenylobacterium]|uniref:TetR family transcriptional regulator n=1 Tax=unclassified Phenylobacterium TaxID=2640670 RepID=UPI0009E9AA66|nr:MULTISPECIES: TetR family transcriptional regulator [unclassified Phenylobacterium]
MAGKTPARAPRADDRSGRDQLLEAASAVMTEAESVHVSLSAIARRAGVTAPLVTYHFGAKQQLLLALARRDTERALEQLTRLTEMDIPPEEMLRIHISGIIRNYARRPYLNQLLNLLLRDEDSAAAREIKETFVAPLAAAQRAIIERGVAEGRFRAVDPALAYFIIVGACRDFFTNKITIRTVLGADPDEDEIKRYTRTVVDVLFNGLLAT